MEAKELLSRGVVDCVVREHLEKRLETGEKLTVKLGIDPTGAELHLGNAVPLRKLRDFARAGHRIVFIIGDFTARVGDPADQDAERTMMGEDEIRSNMAEWLDQVRPILGDAGRDFELRYNSEWLEEFDAADMLKLLSSATVQQVTQRDDFKQRMEAGKPVNLVESIYSLLQGYDSVAIEADLEVGGYDQHLNLLMGREVQKHYGQEPQDVLTFELLEGTDGRKMSKSYGNYIALRDAPADMYGKVMRVRDDLVGRYFLLTTDLSISEIEETESLSPRDRKARLAREIVTLYHGPEAAQSAEAEWGRVFRDKETPSEVEEYVLARPTINIVELLEVSGLAPSKSEARRLIDQGAVRVDGAPIGDYDTEIAANTEGVLLQVGKRRFLRIKADDIS